jgi:hypothetical protein
MLSPMTTRTWRLTAAGSALVVVVGYRLFTLVATLLYSGSVTQANQRNTASSVFAWWDGQWYLQIARHGYDPAYVQHAGTLGNRTEAAFPPALAALMAATHRLFAVDYTVAGLLWGFLALAAAGVGLVRLVELDYGRRIAVLTLAFLLLWPPAIFFGMLYQDGLTLAGVVWAFFFVRRQRPVLAGICLGIACLGKLVVVLALLALAVEVLRGGTDRSRPYRDAGLLAAGPVVAIAGWLAYTGVRFHHLTAAFDAERAWGHELSTPWHSLSVSADAIAQIPSAGYRAVLIGDFVAIGLLVLALLYLAVRRTRPSYVVYTATMLVALTTDGQTFSLGRYLLLVFPVFLAAALAVDRLPAIRRDIGLATTGAVAIAALPAQVWLISRFARYYWAG